MHKITASLRKKITELLWEHNIGNINYLRDEPDYSSPEDMARRCPDDKLIEYLDWKCEQFGCECGGDLVGLAIADIAEYDFITGD